MMKNSFWKKSICMLMTLMTVGCLLLSVFTAAPVNAASATKTKSNFRYTVSDGEATIVSYIGKAKKVTVPAKLGKYPVIEVATGTFWDNDTVESITFSEGISYISTYNDTAIYGCDALKTISYPASFIAYLPELTDGVVSGTFGLYYKCPNVKSIKIARKNPYIKAVDGVVYNKKMTSVLCYPAAKKGTSYVAPKTINLVADSAFQNQKYLKEVVLPDSVEWIGYWAFTGAKKLTKINIPKKCKTIGQFAFQNTNVQTVHIPRSCNRIMECAFLDAPIKKITLDKKNSRFQLIDGVLYAKDDRTGDLRLTLYPIGSKKKSYVMPDNVGSMYWHAFDGAKNLTKITLGENLEVISGRAFVDCEKLKTLIIPKSIKEIERDAINNCYKLTDIFYLGTQKQWKKITIDESVFSMEQPAIHYGTKATAKHNEVIDTGVINAGGGAWYGEEYSLLACGCSRKGDTNGTQPIISSSDKEKIATVATWPGEPLKISMSMRLYHGTCKWYYKDKGMSKFKLVKSFKDNYYCVTMDESVDGRQIYCVITDEYGNTTRSKTVELTAKKPAGITTQPKNAYAESGKKAKVTVQAKGNDLSYKWYYKEKGSTKFKLTKTVTGNTYSAKMSAAKNGRQVYCVVKDKYGNSVKSKTVTLRMK